MEKHFTIHGDWLTDIARSMWAEGDPDKGLELLDTAFPSMPTETKFAVLTGHKKLVGDSNSGMEVMDDVWRCPGRTRNAEAPTLADILEKYRNKIDKLEDLAQFGLGHTICVPSPKGLVEVPIRRTRLVGITQRRVFSLSFEELDNIPHKIRKINAATHLTVKPTNLPNKEEQKPSPPPPAQNYINKDQMNGWLSPEGKFYSCVYGDHINVAERLGEDSVVLERLKWLKIQRGDAWSSEFKMKHITQAQRNVLFQWFVDREIKIPWYLEEE